MIRVAIDSAEGKKCAPSALFSDTLSAPIRSTLIFSRATPSQPVKRIENRQKNRQKNGTALDDQILSVHRWKALTWPKYLVHMDRILRLYGWVQQPRAERD
jgi:hypothetical protein